jgi:hypothetical protein
MSGIEEEYKIQLDKLLDGTDLASKQDPNFFYNLIQDYKTESTILLNDFYEELETDNGLEPGTIDINYDVNTYYNDTTKRDILELKYKILKNNIENLRKYIRAERDVLGDTINDMRNNEHFATTLNSDYSEIYKYKYLRNWGIFLSIVGGAYFFKKMK